MRFLILILIAIVGTATFMVVDLDNSASSLLQKAGLLEGMIARYSASLPPPPEPGIEKVAAAPPPPPKPVGPRDPMIQRLTQQIANLEKENEMLEMKASAFEAKRSGSNTASGDAKRVLRDIEANDKRIAEYKVQLATAIERDKAATR